MQSEQIPRSVKKIEDTILTVKPDDMRHHALQCAKHFKTSWIELGQVMYKVWKDKVFKEWGFSDFDVYTTKEIGIRKTTALKLLRSYNFLQSEEPQYVKKEYLETAETASLPSYESVDTLRLAGNSKKIDKEDYAKIRKYVLEKGKDAKEVKKDLTAIIKDRQELEPEEARAKKKQTTIKRFLGLLRSLKDEMRVSNMVPSALLKEADLLISRLEKEI